MINYNASNIKQELRTHFGHKIQICILYILLMFLMEFESVQEIKSSEVT